MGFRERFGCFFLAVGSAVFLLFAPPLVDAIRRNPSAVPEEWLGAALAALLILWIGWRLHASGRKSAESRKPPSLGSRIAGKWKSGAEENGGDGPRIT